jgi:opine dehydrogenase
VTSGTIVVLGSDAAGVAVAASLARDGREVVLWNGLLSPAAAARGCEGPSVRVRDIGGETVVKLAAVTTDLFAALAVGTVLVACTAPAAQAAFADFVLPLIEPRHTLVLPAGGLGSLFYAQWLHDRGRYTLPTFVETDMPPFVALHEAPDGVSILAAPAGLSAGVFPAQRTATALADVEHLLPGTRAAPHVLAAALAGVVPFLRAPALVLNAGAIERSLGRFALFEDGFTAGVARVAGVLDAERRAIGAALGLELPDAAAALHERGLSPLGDLWEAVNGSRALTYETAGEEATGAGPGSDPAAEAASILRQWVELAGLLGVDAPVAGGLLACGRAASAGVAAGAVAPDAGRSLKDLGIAGMQPDALMRYLDTGSDEPG